MENIREIKITILANVKEEDMEEANREDCSKIPKARKAHKFSTFGRSLSIRTFAGHRHEPPYLLLYLKMKIIHEIGQAAFSYN